MSLLSVFQQNEIYFRGRNSHLSLKFSDTVLSKKLLLFGFGFSMFQLHKLKGFQLGCCSLILGMRVEWETNQERSFTKQLLRWAPFFVYFEGEKAIFSLERTYLYMNWIFFFSFLIWNYHRTFVRLLLH